MNDQPIPDRERVAQAFDRFSKQPEQQAAPDHEQEEAQLRQQLREALAQAQDALAKLDAADEQQEQQPADGGGQAQASAQ